MIDAIQIAGAALRANQQWLDNISGNVANLNSPAYRARETRFAAAVATTTPTGQSNAALARADAGALVTARSGIGDAATGAIRQTGRELDVAIDGAGYFRVIDGEGQTRFTRLGRFVVNAEGALALPDGPRLADDIRVPPDALALRITADGRVTAELPDATRPLELGRLLLADIGDPGSLQEISPGLYRAEDSARIDDGAPDSGRIGRLQQAHLEYSNVDLVHEMTELVLAQRAYQLNARVLQVGDAALETINNLRR